MDKCYIATDASTGSTLGQWILPVQDNTDAAVRSAFRNHVMRDGSGFIGLIQCQAMPWSGDLPETGPIHTFYYRRGISVAFPDGKKFKFRFAYQVTFDHDSLTVKKIEQVEHITEIAISDAPLLDNQVGPFVKAIERSLKRMGNRMRERVPPDIPCNYKTARWAGHYLIALGRNGVWFILSDRPVLNSEKMKRRNKNAKTNRGDRGETGVSDGANV